MLITINNALNSCSLNLGCGLVSSTVLHPLNTLAVVPDTNPYLVLFVGVGRTPMLLSVEPAALILATVGPIELEQSVYENFLNPCHLPGKHAVSFLFVVDVFTSVLTAVLKTEDPEAVHHVVFPVAGETPTIVPLVSALSVHFVQDKISFKGATIVPGETA